MKRYIRIILSVFLITLICSNTAFAASSSIENIVSVTEEYENDYIIETIIRDEGSNNATILNASTSSTTQTTTKSKTTYVKNSSGTVLWYVTVKATFTYNGLTSKCTSSSATASAPASGWSITSCTVSRSGNTATATAKALCSTATASRSYTKSVTIKCSATGVVS